MEYSNKDARGNQSNDDTERNASENAKPEIKIRRKKKHRNLSRHIYQRILEDPDHITFGIPEGYTFDRMRILVYLVFFIGLVLAMFPVALFAGFWSELDLSSPIRPLLGISMLSGLCIMCCPGYLVPAYLTDYVIMSVYGVGEENRGWRRNTFAGIPKIIGCTAFEWKNLEKIYLRTKKGQISMFRFKSGNNVIRVDHSYGCRRLTFEDIERYVPDFSKWVSKPTKGENDTNTYSRPDIAEGRG